MNQIVPKSVIAATSCALALTACTPVDRAEADAQDATLANIDTDRAGPWTSCRPCWPHGRDRIYVHTGVREEWLLEARGACPDLDFSTQIAFDTRGRTSMCTGDMETLLVPDSFRNGFDRCPVEVLGRVIEEEDDP